MFTIKAAISDGQTKTLMDDGHTRRAWFVSKFWLRHSFLIWLNLVVLHKPKLLGGRPTPLTNIEKYEFVSWDYDIPNIYIYIHIYTWKNNPMLYFMKFPISGKSENSCSKPPSRKTCAEKKATLRPQVPHNAPITPNLNHPVTSQVRAHYNSES